ncbi:hypothetical protein [Teredinibacter sp. KSP-S5-2]|uniref:HNH endonuclease n=1 Tax=Teredinibacter sp. KSP-S5-2 TaxID=3034506 RepID=UPI002934E64D|nr:hypothetical protein [Teredinibacter sp. KSP-S5-2]WNO09406.1 hypothetical protein P5V12_20915 [Teredinibacter sp. KSP-S5-2]
MLFPYTQIPHRMRYMHGFVAYIFAKVWCKAPTVEYSLDLFSGMPKLYGIMQELDRQDKAGKEDGAGAFFYRHVNDIFNGFKALPAPEIKTLKKQFLANNNIQALCEGRASPVRYSSSAQTELDKNIRCFFSELYRRSFFNLRLVKDSIGADLHDHYNDFARDNDLPCCPFCGLQPMDNEYDPTREAYDHYLPASVYPFNSVNLKNLAPACHKCNTQYKGAKDPLLDKAGKPKKAFFPYSKVRYEVEIALQFLPDAQLPKTPSELEVELTCQGYEQELDTWNRLYSIKERLSARCCSNATSKAWMNRIKIECRNYQRTPEEALEAELITCDESPWTEASFLKSAYLKEADRKGLLRIED